MQEKQDGVRRRHPLQNICNYHSSRLCLLLLWLGGATGCGPTQAPAFPEESELITGTEAVASSNGLSVNGLSVNGLSLNGLSLNGLSPHSLLSPLFSAWFEANPGQRDMVMRYMVLCAVPEGEART
jgi:hypothetical protein